MKNTLHEPVTLGNDSELLLRFPLAGTDRVPRPKDLAIAVAERSDKWFRRFVKHLQRRVRRRAVAVIGATVPPIDETTKEQLEEELHGWDDLAEEFGLSRENAYRDIRGVLENSRERAASPGTSQSVPMAFTNLLHEVRVFVRNFAAYSARDAPERIASAIENAQRHLDMFGAGADPGVGVDMNDSVQLMELRQIIDDRFGWRSEEEKEIGDYRERLKQIADYVDYANNGQLNFRNCIGERI